MVMSVDHLILVVPREPITLLHRAVEVEIVPVKPRVNVSRMTSLSTLCRMQIPGKGLSGELLSMLADCCQPLRQGKTQQYKIKLID